MKRIWHPYTVWEDFLQGMWRIVPKCEETLWLDVAVWFTGDNDLYGQWMLKVINELPLACEHNLTNDAMNRWAWIGHAACCLATGCPEYITRRAWGLLDETQRTLANARAAIALQIWVDNYEK